MAPKLEHLSLQVMPLGNAGLEALAAALRSGCAPEGIHTITLNAVEMRDTGAVAIAQALLESVSGLPAIGR